MYKMLLLATLDKYFLLFSNISVFHRNLNLCLLFCFFCFVCFVCGKRFPEGQYLPEWQKHFFLAADVEVIVRFMVRLKKFLFL